MFRVAYQGVAGAYSHQAAELFFTGEKIKSVACETFEDVFAAVQKGDTSYGCVPVENTLTGSILENYHLLREYSVGVVGEVMVRISHALLAQHGAKLESIDTVLSHPQALLQCREFLKKHKQMHPEAAFDTAGSAQIVAEKKDVRVAAIASRYAAKLYGLRVLQTDIQQERYNYTRFLLIGNNTSRIGNKATIMYELQHRPGTLQKSLQPFVDSRVNVMKIEAIPIIGRPWEYYFFLDVESGGGKSIHQALIEFKKTCTWFKLLGLYDKGKIYEN